jgi:hypothetical protein
MTLSSNRIPHRAQRGAPTLAKALAGLACSLCLLGHAPLAAAQATPSSPAAAAQQRYEEAVASFRVGRHSEAYGRMIEAARDGHALAAAQALWMFQNGLSLFGKDWDSTPEQQQQWAALAPRGALVASLGPTTR